MLQIVRPDIVVPLSEYTGPQALAATVRTLPATPANGEESPPGEERERDAQRGQAALRLYESVRQAATAPEHALLASDIMTQRPVTLALDAPIEQAREVFRTNHFHHIPLTTPEGRIGGIVSQPYLFRHGADAANRAATTLAELAVRDVLTATPDTTIRELASEMLRLRVGCVPIVDAAGLVVGIITRSDILRVLVQRAPVELWA